MTTEELPPIPDKRYFSISEVGDLCQLKPHVLRYWEQEFSQLRPLKRRGNRRYYRKHDILIVREIRDLLYGQGFTIQGARLQLAEKKQAIATSTTSAGDSLSTIRLEMEAVIKLLDRK